MKLTLVVESDKRRDVRRSDSVSEEYLRAGDADFRQKRVGRQTQFSRESSAQVKLIRPRMFSEILEAHIFGEVLEQERTRSPNTRPQIRCRSCTRCAEKRRKRCEGLGDSSIESKAILDVVCLTGSTARRGAARVHPVFSHDESRACLPLSRAADR